MNHLKKKGEFDFVWLFAIIAGIAILLLFIYGANRAAQTQGTQSNAETALSISIITEPLQSGFAEGKLTEIKFKKNTTIQNTCNDIGFGSNNIATFVQQDLGTEAGSLTEIPVKNKYIFSSPNPSKNYLVFSKSFSLPFKISDLLIMVSNKYCFITPPEEIQQELELLNTPYFEIGPENCSEDSLKVCFEYGNNCDITINSGCMDNYCTSTYNYGTVEKQGTTLTYADNLMYAALVSDSELYECNVKRLLFRESAIIDLLSEKSQLMNARGCTTNMQPQLAFLKTTLEGATSSDLPSIYSNAQIIDKQSKAEKEGCYLW